MKAAGYFLDSRHLLNVVEEDRKGLIICHHSEKLAIAFAWLKLSLETTIRVVKNLRVCSDSHTATKFISNIEEIWTFSVILNSFQAIHHYFKQGRDNILVEIIGDAK